MCRIWLEARTSALARTMYTDLSTAEKNCQARQQRPASWWTCTAPGQRDRRPLLAQVQYAASKATRTFLRATRPFAEEVLPTLLPAMCFNRHATAEGLRAFSQRTWVEALGDGGRSWVARCIGQVRGSAVVQEDCSLAGAFSQRTWVEVLGDGGQS